jgi:hypothetical protein
MRFLDINYEPRPGGAKDLNRVGPLTIVNSGSLGIKEEETKKLTLTRVEM